MTILAAATSPANAKPPRADIYTRVTDRIVSELENGVMPWLKPWNASHAAGRITRPLRHNGQPYSGVNVLMLWDAAETKGYSCPIWLTFKQALDLGGNVRKGEKASPVVYANTFKKKDTLDDGTEVEQEIPFLKEYSVFNAEQCDGLPPRFSALAEPPNDKIERIEHADRFFAATGAEMHHGGNSAHYSVTLDYIAMPKIETFRDAEAYVATLAHETTHWTRHPSRLNRDFGRKRFGDEGYAMEELVAELGAAYLCADLQLTPEVRHDHASYLECWLRVLKGDKKAIFTAASYASKACDFLHAMQPTT